MKLKLFMLAILVGVYVWMIMHEKCVVEASVYLIAICDIIE